MAQYTTIDAEDGFEDTVAGTWSTSSSGFLTLQQTPKTLVGFRFQVHSDLDAKGRPREPSQPSSLSLLLNLTYASTGGTLSVAMLTSPTVGVLGPSNLPSSLASIAMGSATITGPLIAVDTAVPLTIPLPSLTYIPPWAQSSWNGYLGFVLSWTGDIFPLSIAASEHASLAPARLTTTELPFISGIEGHAKAMSRIDRCPRCARLMPREKFVPDGYTRGQLVCPKCWDPVDPPTRPIPSDAPPIND